LQSSKCGIYHTADLVCKLYSRDDNDEDKDDMMTDSDDSDKM
jgi:hypothetical protein